MFYILGKQFRSYRNRRMLDLLMPITALNTQMNVFAITSGKHVRVMNTPLKVKGIPIFFLFLLQNIDCGYGEAVLTCTNNLCFEQK